MAPQFFRPIDAAASAFFITLTLTFAVQGFSAPQHRPLPQSRRGTILMSDQHDETAVHVDDNKAPFQTEMRRPWQEPKLEFVEPKLIKQGEMKQMTTQGFIGTFVP